LFGSLFKKSHEDFPKSKAYTGELSSTHYQEIQQTPIKHVYHQGFYDKLEERPTHTVLKVSKEPYTGPLHSIHHNELQPSPIENLPNQAYYDTPTPQKKSSVVGMLTGLFRRYQEENYPSSTPYSGEYQQTHRDSEFPHHEIHQYSSIYHPGYRTVEEPSHYGLSKEAYTGPLSPTKYHEMPSESISAHFDVKYSEESKQKQSIFDKFGIHRKEIVHENYPARTLPYEGPLNVIQKNNDFDKHNIWEHVSLYHQTGRMDSVEREEVYLDDNDIYENVPSTKVRKGYPRYHEYIGPIDETHHSEIHPTALEFAPYNQGFYTELPTEETTKKKSIFSKLFKTSGHSHMMDFPITERFEGDVPNAYKQKEHHEVPISELVSIYNSGYYDERPTKHFEEYPRQIRYSGPINQTHHSEIHPTALEFAPYHQGFYTELPKREEEPTKKKSIFSKLFKTSGHSHMMDFPITERFEGDVPNAYKQKEHHEVPISELVSIYNSGYYDERPTKHFEEYPRQIRYSGPINQTHHSEIRSTALEFTPYHQGFYTELPKREEEKLFKHKDKDYPVTERFEGDVPNAYRQKEHHDVPISELVSIYNSGHYDKKPTKHFEEYPRQIQYTGPVNQTHHSEIRSTALEFTPYHQGFYTDLPKREEKHGIFEKLFKHKDKGYPVTERFEGDVPNAYKQKELSDEPISHHVTVYSPGHYDERPTKHFEEYPSHIQYTGPINETHHSEIHPTALEFTPYHQGFYADLPKREEEKLFKHKDKDYPVEQAYLGPISLIQPQNEHYEVPIDQLVSIYSLGHYDKTPTSIPKYQEFIGPESTIPLYDESQQTKTTLKHGYPSEEAYTGQILTVPRRYDIFDFPLQKHVSVYHPTGRSDDIQISETSYIDDSSRKSIPKGYPAYYQHSGDISSTRKQKELLKEPLDINMQIPPYSPRKIEEKPTPKGYPAYYQHIGDISSTRKQKELLKEPLDINLQIPPYSPSKKHRDLSTEPLEISSKKLVIKDYPDYYEHHGKISSTHKHKELLKEPLDINLQIPPYSPRKTEEDKTSTLSKFGKLFKFGHTHMMDRPKSDVYEGPLEDLYRHYDIMDFPLRHHVAKSESPVEYQREILVHSSPKIRKSTMPKEDVYQGPLTSLQRQYDIIDFPLRHQVNVYNAEGRSDQIPLEEKTRYGIVASKKAPISGYPTSIDTSGPVHFAYKRSEATSSPLEYELYRYPLEIPPYAAKKTSEDKGGFLNKIFRFGHTHLMDQPKEDVYFGPLSLLSRKDDIIDVPIGRYSSVYHSTGRSDFELPEYGRIPPRLPSEGVKVRKEEPRVRVEHERIEPRPRYVKGGNLK
jgi:uncharacterized protein YcgL (UPF0745 family)